MNIHPELFEKSKNRMPLTREEAETLRSADLTWLSQSANSLRDHHQGSSFDLCTIINGKSGRCSEDCRYCAQSSHYETDAPIFPLLDPAAIVKDAQEQAKKGILRYSIVTSGKRLTEKEVDVLCKAYGEIKETTDLSLCASHGLLTKEQFFKLKSSGVSRYHNNLESSKNYFPLICTTHSYADKVKVIQTAIDAGLTVCSGGIFGLGESWKDRIDMLMDLRDLGVSSIPINFFCPIPGTALASHPLIEQEDALRVIALARFIHPTAAIRLAGGRGQFEDLGKRAFQSGANAAITGDLLTTAGISVNDDKEMIHALGYQINRV